MKPLLKYLIYILLFIIAIGLILIGIPDDAPGAVLIGFLIIITLIILLIRKILKSRKRA